MGGISSRYTDAEADESNHTLDAISIPLLESSIYLQGPITLPTGNSTQADQELQRIINREKQIHMVSGKQMITSLHGLLQQIQLNILANNYNEKNKVILNTLHKDIKMKKGELKDTKETNFADYRRMELIQYEIKQKKNTILLVSIATISLLVLLGISILLLQK
jgi:hypothetical protein